MTDRRFIRHQHIDSQGAKIMVQCRFCRHNEELNKYTHVAPCGCVGPSRYVHRQCLQNWVTVKFQHVYNQPYEGDPLEFNVFCEVCQQRMEIEFQLTSKCSNYDEFLQNLEQYKMWFVFVILVAIISITVLVFLLILTSSDSQNGNVIAFSITACCLVLLADLVFFVWKFAIIKSIDIEKIPNHKDPPKIIGFEEKDLDGVEQEEYEDPHFGGQPSNKDTYAERSLMIQSRRNSNQTDKASSVASKTLTDLVMRQMYKHDMPSEKESRASKYSKEHRRQPLKKDQEAQVTIVQKDQLEKEAREIERRNRSIQMSFDQNSVAPNKRSRSRSRRIFSGEEEPPKQSGHPLIEPIPEHRMMIDKQTPETRPSKRRLQPQSVTKQVGSRQSSEPRESEHFNIIKERPSEPSEPENVPPPQSSKQHPRQSKLKLKTSKDPIKIKLFY